MAPTERPPSRLPGGKINPAWTAWRKAQKAVAPPPEPESPANEILSLKCFKQAVNKRYVYCDLSGIRVAVRCKKGVGQKLVKKTIKVEVDRSGERPVYTHIR